jgi:dsRNA-specific ribonuclease
MNNPNNKLISKKEVEDILNYFGGVNDNGEYLRINNLEYYQRAFVHESYHQAQLQIQSQSQSQSMQGSLDEQPVYINYLSKESNERLEYLGDHILKAILGRYLYQRFGTEREGFLTRLKIKIEKCSMLHKFAVTLGFKQFLLLSLQIENQTLLDLDRGRNTPSYYEDAFESFLGAIMEDFEEKGYIYAERFVRNIIENVIDFSELISKNDNFKDSLQRFFQSLKWKTPVYQNINEEGPLYRKIFTRMLTISKEQFDILDSIQQSNILQYTEEFLEYYKKSSNQIYSLLFSIVSEGNYILCIGTGRKVVNAEQEAAKKGLELLNLDQNY